MIPAEPHAVRMLVVAHGALVADGRRLVADADGSGQRRLTRTPEVAEWGPSWLPDGSAIVYSAEVSGRPQVRVFPFRRPLDPEDAAAGRGA